MFEVPVFDASACTALCQATNGSAFICGSEHGEIALCQLVDSSVSDESEHPIWNCTASNLEDAVQMGGRPVEKLMTACGVVTALAFDEAIPSDGDDPHTDTRCLISASWMIEQTTTGQSGILLTGLHADTSTPLNIDTYNCRTRAEPDRRTERSLLLEVVGTVLLVIAVDQGQGNKTTVYFYDARTGQELAAMPLLKQQDKTYKMFRGRMGFGGRIINAKPFGNFDALLLLGFGTGFCCSQFYDLVGFLWHGCMH